MQERNPRRSIKEYLDSLPGAWGFCTTGVSERGVPDLVYSIDGHFIGIEVKGDGDQSEIQKVVERKVKQAGGSYWVCRSVEEVKEHLISWEAL